VALEMALESAAWVIGKSYPGLRFLPSLASAPSRNEFAGNSLCGLVLVTRLIPRSTVCALRSA
jgi:hypothetical protein